MSGRISGSPWDPPGGGQLATGCSYSRLWERTARIQKTKGTDQRRQPRVQETPEYVEGQRYTRKQLTFMADEILRQDDKDIREDPCILLPEHYKDRMRREVYVSTGIPDPSVASGLYWRTHPEGRRVHSDERRKKGATFYR